MAEATNPAPDSNSTRRFIIDAWLAEQRDYHKRNAAKKERLAQRTRTTVLLLFSATFLMAILHLSPLGHLDPELYGKPLVILGQLFTFLAVALPGWGAAVHAVSKQLEYERIAARSERMHEILDRLVVRAEAADELTELRAVVREATRLIELENFEWWVVLSFDQPELAA